MPWPAAFGFRKNTSAGLASLGTTRPPRGRNCTSLTAVSRPTAAGGSSSSAWSAADSRRLAGGHRQVVVQALPHVFGQQSAKALKLDRRRHLRIDEPGSIGTGEREADPRRDAERSILG